MTISTKHPRRMALSAAAIAALLLAGCSSDNVGESWQCPLANAGTCDSVSAADPAVPDMNGPRSAVLREPLWRVRAAEPDTPVPPVCSAECEGGFNPFGWLARRFGAGEDDSGTADPEPQPLASKTSTAAAPAAVSPTDALPAEPGSGGLPASPGTAALPAEPDVIEPHRITENPHVGNLRTDEVVARIWIAPFVDADGVYREGSWVRAVLEPAGWRLGR